MSADEREELVGGKTSIEVLTVERRDTDEALLTPEDCLTDVQVLVAALETNSGINEATRASLQELIQLWGETRLVGELWLAAEEPLRDALPGLKVADASLARLHFSLGRFNTDIGYSFLGTAMAEEDESRIVSYASRASREGNGITAVLRERGLNEMMDELSAVFSDSPEAAANVAALRGHGSMSVEQLLQLVKDFRERQTTVAEMSEALAVEREQQPGDIAARRDILRGLAWLTDSRRMSFNDLGVRLGSTLGVLDYVRLNKGHLNSSDQSKLRDLRGESGSTMLSDISRKVELMRTFISRLTGLFDKPVQS